MIQKEFISKEYTGQLEQTKFGWYQTLTMHHPK